MPPLDDIEKRIKQYQTKQLRRLRNRLVASALSIITLLGVGTIVFHALESWTWIQSFYFSVITLTTIGYGDLTPTSDTSRLVTAVFVLAGVGVMIAALGVIGTSYLESRTDIHERIKAKRS